MEAFRERHAGRLPSQLQGNMQAIQSWQLELSGVAASLEADRARKAMTERLYNDSLAELQMAATAPPPIAPTGDPTAATNLTARQQLEAARAARPPGDAADRRAPGRDPARRMIKDLEVRRRRSKLAQASPGSATPRATTPEETQRRERVSSLRAELDQLNRQIAYKERDQARLRGEIADYRGRLNSVPGLESEWTSLSRDYDTLQESYRGLLKKSEDSKVAANLESRRKANSSGSSIRPGPTAPGSDPRAS